MLKKYATATRVVFGTWPVMGRTSFASMAARRVGRRGGVPPDFQGKSGLPDIILKKSRGR